MARIGLVAGSGGLPMLFSDAAKVKGDTVIAFGLKGVTSEELAKHADKVHWLGWGDFQKGIMLLVTERIRKIVMLGKIEKELLFKEGASLDDKSKNMLDKIKDKKDYAVLGEVAKVMSKFGIEIIDPTEYLNDLTPSKGLLTKSAPSKNELDDIEYGRTIAKELSRFDIGQAVVVKDKTVIALEAVEGTDEAIVRAGRLSSGGFSVIKVARPNQDMRFDVPLVGLDTLKALINAKGRVLALEEKRTILINKDELIKLADENGISIIVI